MLIFRFHTFFFCWYSSRAISPFVSNICSAVLFIISAVNTKGFIPVGVQSRQEHPYLLEKYYLKQ